MIISPLRAFIGTPFTSMLTNSSVMPARPRCRARIARPGIAQRSCRNRSLLLDDATAAVVDHVFELVGVVLDEALHRPRRRIAERADRVALDVIRDVDEQAEVLAPALPGQDALQHPVEPPGALAARGALS